MLAFQFILKLNLKSSLILPVILNRSGKHTEFLYKISVNILIIKDNLVNLLIRY